MGAVFLTKEARIYNGTKTASSINGAGKTGHLGAQLGHRMETGSLEAAGK